MIPSWAISTDDSLPNDVETLKSMLVAERAARMAAEGEAQHGALLIEKLKYTTRKLRHERFGQSSERGTLLLADQRNLRGDSSLAHLALARPTDFFVVQERFSGLATHCLRGSYERAHIYPPGVVVVPPVEMTLGTAPVPRMMFLRP